MDRDELKEKLAKQLYEWIDDDGWEWREITKTSRDVYRVKAAAILSLLAPILADAERWKIMEKEYPNICARLQYNIIVDALDGEAT
jgi:hypothetical protein